MARTDPRRKQRKTFTLSREAVSFLENVKRESKGKSTSSVLEELIRERQREREMKRMAVSISSYYDSLSDAEREDNKLWGKFSESQFRTE